MTKETCHRCKEDFEDKNFDPNLPFARRIFCDKCVDELSGENK